MAAILVAERCRLTVASFAFYIVDSTHIKVIEEDLVAATSGNVVQQAGSIPAQNSAFTGSFVYVVGGVAVIGTQGADARVARFTADGNGGIAAISYDENNNGSTRHISQGSNISNASYAIDTANAGTGRGTFTFTDSSGGDLYVRFLPALANPGGCARQQPWHRRRWTDADTNGISLHERGNRRELCVWLERNTARHTKCHSR